MRILQITEAASAGVGRHLIDLLEGLVELGCDSHVVYSTRRMDTVFDERLRPLPVKSLALEMRRGPHPSDLFVLQSLRAYLRQHGPFDIIHAHSTKAGLLARLLPKRGAKVVYTPHCIYTMNPQASPLAARSVRALECLLATRTDAIVAVSPDEKHHLRSLGIAGQKLRCIVNGVDPPATIDKQRARKHLGLPAEGVIIGFLGRLSQQKDPLLFVRAVASIVGKRENVTAAIAGSGELESAGRALAEQLGVAQQIHWLGFQTAPDVMPALDIFAMSSRYEGMPYTLLEAIAMQLPVVTTDVGGARLTVNGGKNGFVVPVGNERALAEKLALLASNATLRADFALASGFQARKFSIQAMISQTCELYCNLCGQNAQVESEDTRLQPEFARDVMALANVVRQSEPIESSSVA